MLCDGSIAVGTYEPIAAPPLCSSSAQTECLTSAEFKAIDVNELSPDKILAGTSIAGITGAAEAPECPAVDAWDLRRGATVGDVVGKLPTKCRNAISAGAPPAFNYDGDPVTISNLAVTNGTTLDWWDTVDHAFLASFDFLSPTGWSTENTRCGGVEDTLGDDKIWRDETSGTCSDAGKECVFRDKITNLQWTEEFPISFWNAAIDHCATLDFAGYDDWRLPTQKEMLTASVHGINDIEATTAHMADFDQIYWSATSYSADSSNAWYVVFSNGYSRTAVKATNIRTVCVR